MSEQLPGPSTPAADRPATRLVRDWVSDSRQWERYAPRPGDVVISTFAKAGTTWTQQIVRLLVFQDPAPRPLTPLSPWIDARFQIPPDVMFPMIEAQTHRRFLKAHLPLDALPVYEGVRYIHVARDGRDTCMSFLNHCNALTADALARLDEIGLADETIGRPYPRAQASPRGFFHDWLDGTEGRSDSMTAAGFFHLERSFWAARAQPNVLLVHYNDLTADLAGEMRRIADFLEIEVPEPVWPRLVEAATFEDMKANGADLLAGVERAIRTGHEAFLFKGTNGRWRDTLTPEDLALYDARVADELSPGLRRWLESGRAASDPRSWED